MMRRNEGKKLQSDFKGKNKRGLVVDPRVSRYQLRAAAIRRYGRLYVLINHR